jgi:YbbR domain-containing protein
MLTLETASHKVHGWIVNNWPIKLTALILAAILWAVVAAQEPTNQLVPVRLEVTPPHGRAIASELPPIQALFAGTPRELLKLYSRQPVIRMTVPDTLSGSEYTLELSTADISVIEDAAVNAQDIEPRIVPIRLDDVALRRVPVIPRVSVAPDSGYRQFGGIVVEPESVDVRGPEEVVRRTSSIFTVRRELTGLREPLTMPVPLDTTRLGGGLSLSTLRVDITVDVGEISERVLIGVPVTVLPRTSRGTSDPPAVLVTIEGQRDRLNRLTADSIRVIARVTSGAGDVVTVHLDIEAPDEIAAWATPDSVVVHRGNRD